MAYFGEEEVKYISLPPPNRHYNLIKKAKQEGWTEIQIHTANQGFLYEEEGTKYWCRRKPAFRIAKKAGQIIRDHDNYHHGLFSEHVW